MIVLKMRSNPQDWYRIEASAGSEADVWIYDEISWLGVQAEQFVRELNAVKASTIRLHINSPGGNVFDGSTIHNALRMHPAKVVTHIEGLAASIASYIALAGDEIVIADAAMVMIHDPWAITIGDADEHRKTQEVLEKVAANMAEAYAARLGVTAEDARGLMRSETWWTAREAVEVGFADAIVGGEDAKALKNFDLSIFRNALGQESVSDSDAMRRRMARMERMLRLAEADS
jgi:ATP-dependent protease ClpP protease subunit